MSASHSEDAMDLSTADADETESLRKQLNELKRHVQVLEAENILLKSENADLKTRLKNNRLTLGSLPNNTIALYTSLPDRPTLDLVVDMLSRFNIKYHSDWNVRVIPFEDQVLLTLMKLRLNPPNLDLATRFNVSTATVTNIFLTILEVFHVVFFKGLMEGKLPSLAKTQMDAPQCFKQFPNCRVILDCTEVRTAKPENLTQNCQTFSHYKKTNTMKGLVGITPNGVISFASMLYGGSASDKAITQDSGVLDLLNPGDLILADKGFTIHSILPPGVTVNHPSFLCNPQFTPQEVGRNKEISRARIHVERAIQRLKVFEILEYIPHHYRHVSSKIFQCACCLANLQNPILADR